ncbi:MAG: hypothetical protein U1E65_34755 [Myxococcota bacterium]
MQRALLGLLIFAACAEQPPAQPPVKGLGDRLQSFMGFDPETQKYGCPICARAGSPNLVLIGDTEAADFRADLSAIDALAKAEPGLSAYAISTKRYGEDKAGGEAIRALRTSLGLTLPIILVPADQAQFKKRGYIPFETLYPLAKQRTVLLTDADGKVVFWTELTPATVEASLDRLQEQAKLLRQAL